MRNGCAPRWQHGRFSSLEEAVAEAIDFLKGERRRLGLGEALGRRGLGRTRSRVKRSLRTRFSPASKSSCGKRREIMARLRLAPAAARDLQKITDDISGRRRKAVSRLPLWGALRRSLEGLSRLSSEWDDRVRHSGPASGLGSCILTWPSIATVEADVEIIRIRSRQAADDALAIGQRLNLSPALTPPPGSSPWRRG